MHRRIVAVKRGPAVAQHFYTIKNCEFTFKCPRAWEQLDLTDKFDERHCASCDRLVYLCHDDEALARHVQAGHCVGVEDIANAGSMLLGQIASEYSAPTPEQPQVPKEYSGLKIARSAFDTKVDTSGKINWD